MILFRRVTSVLVLLALCGCNYPLLQSDAANTRQAVAVYTQAAQTIAADFTELAAPAITETRRPPAKLTATFTAEPPAPPTATARQGYTPAVPTARPQATPTPTEATLPITGSDCNRMDYLTDVTAPPDTAFLTGSSFIKTWRVRNSGTCSWGSNYALVYTGGDLTGPTTVVYLPFEVPPGGTVDLSASLVAPLNPGIYASNWMMRSADGQMFGYGEEAIGPLPVRIRAYQPTTTHQFPFDFSIQACTAAWRSPVGALPCPGDVNSTNGAALFLDSPALETNISREYGLLTHPNRDRQGWITGEFPAYYVQYGDHFVSELACQAGSQSCNVRFQLQYRDSLSGATSVIGDWSETYDNGTTPVSLDLSFLSGRMVTFILAVYNRGDPRWADAIWVLPRIQRLAPATQYTLNWTREGYSNSASCDLLRISLTGPATALATAYDCQSSNLEIGRAALSFNQAAQLWRWIQRLQDFEGETYSTTAGRAVTSWIDFHGVGLDDASSADIQSINTFATQLFNQITR